MASIDLDSSVSLREIVRVIFRQSGPCSAYTSPLFWVSAPIASSGHRLMKRTSASWFAWTATPDRHDRPGPCRSHIKPAAHHRRRSELGSSGDDE